MTARTVSCIESYQSKGSMASLCKGSGTLPTRTLRVGSARAVYNCRGRPSLQQPQYAATGHADAAGSIEGISHPAIPRLRDIFFGSTAPQSPITAAEHVASPVAEADHRQDIHQLPDWAQQFYRQVPALPNGSNAMHYLLLSCEEIRAKAADGLSNHRGVLEAYLQLALTDITSQCWQERLQELEALQARVEQGSIQMQQIKQQMLEARLALSGCRYLRLDAVSRVAKQVHLLVDDCGHSPTLDVTSLPQPHITGINFPQMLQQGLGLDLQNPVLNSLSDLEVQNLQGLSWDEYHTKALDHSLIGEWQFCYWFGNASLVPAPYGKFGTGQLARLLTPEVVLGSLPNGVWGRALVAAAIEVGVVLESWAEPSRVMAGAGHVGSASAWMFFESQVGVHGNMQKVRQLALAVAAAAVTMVQQHQQQQ